MATSKMRSSVAPPDGDQGVERLAAHELHGEKRNAVRLLDRVDRDDVGVVQRRDGARLAPEALDPLRRSRHLGRQDLERDLARELRVLGQVDLAHAALAELPENPVLIQHLANHHRQHSARPQWGRSIESGFFERGVD